MGSEGPYLARWCWTKLLFLEARWTRCPAFWTQAPCWKVGLNSCGERWASGPRSPRIWLIWDRSATSTRSSPSSTNERSLRSNS